MYRQLGLFNVSRHTEIALFLINLSVNGVMGYGTVRRGILKLHFCPSIFHIGPSLFFFSAAVIQTFN